MTTPNPDYAKFTTAITTSRSTFEVGNVTSVYNDTLNVIQFDISDDVDYMLSDEDEIKKWLPGDYPDRPFEFWPLSDDAKKPDFSSLLVLFNLALIN